MLSVRDWKDRWKALRVRVQYPDLFDDERQKRSLSELRDRVAGREVAIVGNAESLFWRDDGDLIDRCDLVMRLNRGFIRDPKCQGTRTDIICLSASVTLSEIKSAFGDAQIVYATSRRWRIAKDVRAISSSVVFYPLSAWQRLSALIGGKRPSTGLMAIDLGLTHLGARSVNLFGFDWKESKTFYADDLRTHHHDWQAERALVASWASTGRVVLPLVGHEG